MRKKKFVMSLDGSNQFTRKFEGILITFVNENLKSPISTQSVLKLKMEFIKYLKVIYHTKLKNLQRKF